MYRKHQPNVDEHIMDGMDYIWYCSELAQVPKNMLYAKAIVKSPAGLLQSFWENWCDSFIPIAMVCSPSPFLMYLTNVKQSQYGISLPIHLP